MEEEQDRLANGLHGPDRDKQAAEARRAVLQCGGPGDGAAGGGEESVADGLHEGV